MRKISVCIWLARSLLKFEQEWMGMICICNIGDDATNWFAVWGKVGWILIVVLQSRALLVFNILTWWLEMGLTGFFGSKELLGAHGFWRRSVVVAVEQLKTPVSCLAQRLGPVSPSHPSWDVTWFWWMKCSWEAWDEGQRKALNSFIEHISQADVDPNGFDEIHGIHNHYSDFAPKLWLQIFDFTFGTMESHLWFVMASMAEQWWWCYQRESKAMRACWRQFIETR